MRALPWRGRFDLVTCLDDALNYLLEPADVRAAIAAMARALAPGGVLVFDVNTLLTYRTAFAGDSSVGGGDASFRWRGGASSEATAGDVCAATIEVAARGCFTRSRHVQRHHPREEIEAALVSAGLEPGAVHGLRTGGAITEAADEDLDLKAIHVARRPGAAASGRG